MIEYLQQVDASMLVAINGWHGALADHALWMVSSRLSWALPVLALLLTLRRKPWRQAVTMVLAVALVILVADQVSSSIIKHAVERLRPTHEPSLEAMVRVVNDYRGGLYGFVSSHAANTVGVTVLLCATMRYVPLTLSLSLWTVLVCYSRMYLGVHYPGDILGGAIVGAAAAALVLWLAAIAGRRTHSEWALPQFSTTDSRVMTLAVTLNAVAIFLIAVAQTFL